MTILPALSIRCSSVVNGGPGSWRSALCHRLRTMKLTAPSKTGGVSSSTKQMNGELTIRVITTFSKLHNDIEQSRLSLLLARGTCSSATHSRQETRTHH
jgi:hypothetical protein